MGYGKEIDVDYKKLADDLLSYCHMHSADCEYAGENEFECTIARLSSRAITELLAREEAAEERCKELEERCKRLNEARERANEAAAKWESMYHLGGGISMVDQECDFEHLYNQTKYMLEKYQDEIIPAFRELLYNREPIDQMPLLKCGDLVEINPERRKNKWKKGVVSQVLLCKGDEWVYNITVKHGYPETKHISCKDEDIGDWVKPVR